ICASASGVWPCAAIHCFANRTGEYHTAPSAIVRTAATRAASALTWVMGMGASRVSGFAEQLERVVPAVRLEPVRDPYHSQGLQVASALDAADVDHAPPEGFHDVADLVLRAGVVARDEHVGRAARELRLEHVSVADGVERLDHLGSGEPPLDLLPRRVGESYPERGRTVGHGLERVGDVDDDLAHEILRVRELDGVLRAGPGGREHGDLAELGRLARACDRAPSSGFSDPELELVVFRLAGADLDVVAQSGEALAERLADRA